MAKEKKQFRQLSDEELKQVTGGFKLKQERDTPEECKDEQYRCNHPQECKASCYMLNRY